MPATVPPKKPAAAPPALAAAIPLLAVALALAAAAAARPQTRPGEFPPFAPAPAAAPDDDLDAIFLGRLRYSNNDGNDCTNVGRSLAALIREATTITIGDERVLRLDDARLFDTPFLFMNGHNDFEWTDGDLDVLRSYLGHGGFLFASGCCTNPGFPVAWRREMARLFPGETPAPIPYGHPIYSSYYKIGAVPCLHEPRQIRLEGLFHQGHLVAVMCPDGLCCAFSMENRCNAGRGVSPDDGRKLALNIAIYAITH